MIKGIGIDIIELQRIENSLQRNNRFIERVLTINEQEYFQGLQSDKRKTEFVAGRFAAKEAFSKALGTGLGKLSFQDIEVMANEKGSPIIIADATSIYNVFVSISHSETYAVAQVIIEE